MMPAPDSLRKDDDIVYIPVPRRMLPALYRVLASAMAESSDSDLSALPGGVGPEVTKRNLIDLTIQVAYGMGANLHPVSLPELHEAYIRAYPGIGKGTTRGSFDATLNYHCINMRSRFPDPADKQKPASWLSKPVFKRVERARYMLLSDDEIAWFRRCVEKNHPLVYEDEYDVANLAQCAED